MTDQQHQITPPPKLVEQWHSNSPFDRGLTLATKAAQWGADQELKACRMEIIDGVGRIHIDETKDRVRLAENIWNARRPKPPSLKEQALSAIGRFTVGAHITADGMNQDFDTIRRALEQLND